MSLEVITISGLDGSGKSTQSKMLADYLESKEFKTYYFHATQFSIAQKVFAKKRKGKQHNEAVTNASSPAILLRKLAFRIDLLRFAKLKNNLEVDGVDYIISDRYFYDTLVNIYFLKSEVNLPDVKIPTPDYSFFLDISPRQIMKRQRIPEQGIEYLSTKRKLYIDAVKKYNIKVIDAENDADKILSLLKATLNTGQSTSP